MNPIIDNFKSVYVWLNASSIDRIREIYDVDITFADPFNEVTGLDSLVSYFSKLYENLELCQFEFMDVYSKTSSAMITWNMRFRHRSLSKNIIQVSGATEVRFNQKIYYHRDYFDAGKMIYENIPVVGHVVKFIKNQV
jgi:limonene-1,2-epoxide hydrolase